MPFYITFSKIVHSIIEIFKLFHIKYSENFRLSNFVTNLVEQDRIISKGNWIISKKCKQNKKIHDKSNKKYQLRRITQNLL